MDCMSSSNGIPLFSYKTQLDAEMNESGKDTAGQNDQKVLLEEPNLSIPLEKLLEVLPTRDEIRRELGFGPLEIPIPEAATFSVVRKTSINRTSPNKMFSLFVKEDVFTQSIVTVCYYVGICVSV